MTVALVDIGAMANIATAILMAVLLVTVWKS
jgi:hypothetical protein